VNKFFLICAIVLALGSTSTLANNGPGQGDGSCVGNCPDNGGGSGAIGDINNTNTNTNTAIGGAGGAGGNGGAGGSGGSVNGVVTTSKAIQGQSQSGFGSGNSTTVSTNVDTSNASDYPVNSAIAPALGSAPQGFCVRTEGGSFGVSTFGFGVSGGAYHQVDDKFCQRITLIQNLGLLPSNFQIDGHNADEVMGALFVQFPEIREAISELEGTSSYAVPTGVTRSEPILRETDGGADNRTWEPTQVNMR